MARQHTQWSLLTALLATSAPTHALDFDLISANGQNGDFETPQISTNWQYIDNQDLPGWRSNSLQAELWSEGTFNAPSLGADGLPTGQHAEIVSDSTQGSNQLITQSFQIPTTLSSTQASLNFEYWFRSTPHTFKVEVINETTGNQTVFSETLSASSPTQTWQQFNNTNIPVIAGNRYQVAFSHVSGSTNAAHIDDLSFTVQLDSSLPSNWPNTYPLWWYDPTSPSKGLIDATKPELNQQNHSPLLQGQLLHMAAQGIAELDTQLAANGGATFDISTFSNGNPPSYYSPANIGQLKFVASKFYDRFAEVGFDDTSDGWPTGMTLDPTTGYPWPTNTGPQNLAIANIGQAKFLFAWDLSDFTLPPPNLGPAAPSDLQVLEQLDGTITLTWSDNSDNEESFSVIYSEDGGTTYTEVTSTEANITAYTIPPGTLTNTYDTIFAVASQNTTGATQNAAGATTAQSDIDGDGIPDEEDLDRDNDGVKDDEDGWPECAQLAPAIVSGGYVVYPITQIDGALRSNSEINNNNDALILAYDTQLETNYFYDSSADDIKLLSDNRDFYGLNEEGYFISRDYTTYHIYKEDSLVREIKYTSPLIADLSKSQTYYPLYLSHSVEAIFSNGNVIGKISDNYYIDSQENQFIITSEEQDQSAAIWKGDNTPEPLDTEYYNRTINWNLACTYKKETGNITRIHDINKHDIVVAGKTTYADYEYIELECGDEPTISGEVSTEHGYLSEETFYPLDTFKVLPSINNQNMIIAGNKLWKDTTAGIRNDQTVSSTPTYERIDWNTKFGPQPPTNLNANMVGFNSTQIWRNCAWEDISDLVNSGDWSDIKIKDINDHDTCIAEATKDGQKYAVLLLKVDLTFAEPTGAAWDDLEEKQVILEDEKLRVKVSIPATLPDMQSMLNALGDKLTLKTSGTLPAGAEITMDATNTTFVASGGTSELRVELERDDLVDAGLLPDQDEDGVQEFAWLDTGSENASEPSNQTDGEAFDSGASGERRGQAREKENEDLQSDPALSPIDKSFMIAGGVELITAEIQGAESEKRQIENQADVLYFSGHGSIASGNLQILPGIIGTHLSASEVTWDKDLDVVIIAGCSVLGIGDFRYKSFSFASRIFNYGNLHSAGQIHSPGEEWENVGPGYLLGYAWAAPLDNQGAVTVVNRYTSHGGNPIAAWGHANDPSVTPTASNACAIDTTTTPHEYWYWDETSDSPVWTKQVKGATGW